MTVGPARRSLSRLLVKSVLIVAWTVGLLISLMQVAYDLHQVRQLPADNLATVRGMTQEPLDASVYGLDQARVADLLAGLMEALLGLARKHADWVMPGYTHLQRAQPVYLGHLLMAWLVKMAWSRSNAPTPARTLPR